MKYILVLFITSYYLLLVNVSKGQTAANDNKLSQTISFHPIPEGPTLVGIFEGRPPCLGLAKQLGIETDADCPKLKCDLTLYQDSITFQPTKYVLSIVGGGDIVKQAGGSYRYKVLEGKYAIVKGIKANPDANIYRLELSTPGNHLYVFKGDDNVLFILDEKGNFRIGNDQFSYTLNRVELIFKKQDSGN